MERLRAQLRERAQHTDGDGGDGDGGDGDGGGQPEIRVASHEDIGIDSDAKEAMAFALLGYLCLTGTPASVPSCTGARAPVVLGKICPRASGGGGFGQPWLPQTAAAPPS